MNHIGIICAMPEEIAPFKKGIQVEQEEQIGAIQLWQGQYEGKQITLVQSGMGKVHAAAATQILISKYKPDAIMSCGTAGSLQPAYHIGDVIIAEKTVQHDYGFLLPDTFISFGFRIRTADRTTFVKEFPADVTLLNLAKSLGNPQEQIAYGILLTGDQVILSSGKRQTLVEQFGAAAVDMESAAIAQVAYMYAVPFLAVRGISDQADETFPIDFSKLDPNEFEAFSSASSGAKIRLLTKAIRYFVQHPSKFAPSLQARQNIKKAAQNSALVTLNLLKAI
jgi:adenosylhomocysteine nucleosidase